MNFASAVGILESKRYDRVSGRQVGEDSPGPGEGIGELRSRITRPHCFSVYQAAAHGWEGVVQLTPAKIVGTENGGLLRGGRKDLGLEERTRRDRNVGRAARDQARSRRAPYVTREYI